MPATDELFAARYAALSSRDARFDGQFIAGVHTTGIYCRPSCPAITPKREQRPFYRTAAAAHEAGLRACKRCQPDAVPGSPDWNLRDDLASRAMRLVHDGVVERDGVDGLARRLGYTRAPRQPGAPRRSSAPGRSPSPARTAPRRHARCSPRPSCRSATSPSRPDSEPAPVQRHDRRRLPRDPVRTRAISRRGRHGTAHRGRRGRGPTELTLRLPARAPFDGRGLFRFFADHAIRGFEEPVTTRGLRPATLLPGGVAQIDVAPTRTPPGVAARRDSPRSPTSRRSSSRVRRMFDLDADSVAIDAALGRRPRPRAARRRDPRHPDRRQRRRRGGAVPHADRTADLRRRGTHRARPARRATSARALPDRCATRRARAEVLRGPAARVARHPPGRREPRGRATCPSTPRSRSRNFRARLLALPGIGPWTADYLAMRVLGNPDILPVDRPRDPAERRRARTRRQSEGPGRRAARAWAPWRSYAALHLLARAACAGACRGAPKRGEVRASGPRTRMRHAFEECADFRLRGDPRPQRRGDARHLPRRARAADPAAPTRSSSSTTAVRTATAAIAAAAGARVVIGSRSPASRARPPPGRRRARRPDRADRRRHVCPPGWLAQAIAAFEDDPQPRRAHRHRRVLRRERPRCTASARQGLVARRDVLFVTVYLGHPPIFGSNFVMRREVWERAQGRGAPRGAQHP